MDCSTPGFPPSPSPRACLNSCLLSQWCHPTISSSVAPFSSCPQSFSASESFPMSQFFESGGQSIGVSASASVLPMNIQSWFPLGWTGLISLLSKGHSSLLQDHSSRTSVLQCSAFFMVQLSPFLEAWIFPSGLGEEFPSLWGGVWFRPEEGLGEPERAGDLKQTGKFPICLPSA